MDNNGFIIERVVMVDDSFIDGNTALTNIPEEVVSSASFNEELEEYIESNDGDEEKTLNDFFIDEDIDKRTKDFFFKNLNKDYKVIMDFFGEAIIEKYHPSQFNKEKIDSYQHLSGNTLFILDKILSNHNYESILRTILENINDLLTKKSNCYLFLYSSEVEDFKSHNDVLEYLSKTIKLSKDGIKMLSMHLNFVKKTADLDQFLISTAIRKSQKANFLFSFYEIQENSMRTVNNRIWDINNNEMLVHYNYLSEGQHIDEILFDIYQSKFLKEYEGSWESNYERLVRPLRDSIHSYIGKHEDVNYYAITSRITKELNNEFQRSNSIKHVNVSNDIAYGDIIKIDDGFFLVLSQQCDITVRANGTRLNKEIFLLEVEKNENILDARSIDTKINTILKHNSLDRLEIQSLFNEPEIVNLIKDEAILEELKNRYSRKKYAIKDTIDRNRYEEFRYKKNAGAYYIPSFILDCLLLSDSQGSIEVRKESIESNISIRHSTKLLLLNEFTLFIKELEELITKVDDDQIIGKTIFPRLNCEVLKSDGKVIGIKYLNISREGRLDVETASEIHQTYSNHLMRIGKNEAAIL